MLLTAALEGLALALVLAADLDSTLAGSETLVLALDAAFVAVAVAAAVAAAGALDGALAVGFDLDFEDDGVLVETGINN